MVWDLPSDSGAYRDSNPQSRTRKVIFSTDFLPLNHSLRGAYLIYELHIVPDSKYHQDHPSKFSELNWRSWWLWTHVFRACLGYNFHLLETTWHKIDSSVASSNSYIKFSPVFSSYLWYRVLAVRDASTEVHLLETRHEERIWQGQQANKPVLFNVINNVFS